MSYIRPTKFLTALVVAATMLSVVSTLFISFTLAQEFGQASVKACCCIEESHK